MTITTKAALAAELGVTKSRVSQYVSAGLPVRSDGKLDRETALDWLAVNCRSADSRKGPEKARTLRPPTPLPTRSLGDAEAARRALVGLAAEVGYYTACAASDLGLDMRSVYALTAGVQSGIADAMREQLARIGYRETTRLATDPKALPVDWHAMAEAHGEPVDFAGWEAFRAAKETEAWGKV